MKKEDRSYEVVRRGGIEAALLLCLALFLFTGVLFAQAQNAEATAVSPQQADNATLLAVYVLAFDNDREADDSINLTYKYTPTVQSLVAATDARRTDEPLGARLVAQWPLRFQKPHPTGCRL